MPKKILQTAVGLGALSLAVRSAKMAKDNLKKPSTKNMIKGFTDLAIGTAFLVPISKEVNKL